MRLVGAVGVLLVLPILTLVVWGDWLERAVTHWQATPPVAGWLAAGVVAVLAADILLPVPSGPVITLASGQLGIGLAAVAAWVGLMLGSVAGFAVAKRYGPAVAKRLANPDDLARLRQAAREHDVWLLLVTRPLPIVAEAAVLLAGTLDTTWRRLLGTLAIGNAAVAVAFAVLGAQAAEHEWMATAVVLSVVIPLAGTWFLRRRYW